jgi:hypothetical protein
LLAEGSKDAGVLSLPLTSGSIGIKTSIVDIVSAVADAARPRTRQEFNERDKTEDPSGKMAGEGRGEEGDRRASQRKASFVTGAPRSRRRDLFLRICVSRSPLHQEVCKTSKSFHYLSKLAICGRGRGAGGD